MTSKWVVDLGFIIAEVIVGLVLSSRYGPYDFSFFKFTASDT